MMRRRSSSAAEERADVRPGELLTVRDFERAARRVLTKQAYDYYRSGADAERTLRENVRAFERWSLRPRVLVDVAERDLSIELLGERLASPIGVAPTAYHKLATPDGEVATARACAESGTLLVVSTLATTSLEDVAAAASGPRWFQLYVHRDRGFTRSLVERAHAAGYKALALTADTPLLGRRLRDVRNRFALPEGLTMANLPADPAPDGTPASALQSYVASRHDASLTWKDLEWLRSIAPMPLVLKGVMRGDDAARAITEGVAAIWVSNHGARQLDGVPATLDVLPEVVSAVAGRVPVLLDGGVRWGTDVLKALALGAAAVMIGRPLLWGLAAGGERGAARLLGLLREELSTAMALAGARTIADIGPDLVRPHHRPLG
jgi:isopentenyl diphosphate isomerase/L-lactate dehydrogenase-like FMN-dependent dehydrogenase